MTREVARQQVVRDLEEGGLLDKVVPHTHQVGFSERTGAVVEPRLSTQWFVKMKSLVGPALRSVEEGEVAFYPAKLQNMYRSWLTEVRDWCVSRQLWWGHRIPAYYLEDGRHVVGETLEEALEEARALTGVVDLPAEALRQDEDVLDTWFSSSLWPMNVFGGVVEPEG